MKAPLSRGANKTHHLESAGNPTKYVSDRLGIERWELGTALHKIKARAHLRGTDQIVILDDGSVQDAAGDEIGNVHDEV